MAARPKLKLKRWLYFPIMIIIAIIATIIFRKAVLSEIPKISQRNTEIPEIPDDQLAADLVQASQVYARMFAYLNEGKWGYKDENGNIVNGLEPQFSSAEEFSDGYAFATRNTENGKVYAVIDSSGAIIADNLEIQEARPFSSGYAAYKKDGKWGYMDSQGLSVVAATYDFAGDVSGNTFNRGIAKRGVDINSAPVPSVVAPENIGETSDEVIIPIDDELDPSLGGGEPLDAIDPTATNPITPIAGETGGVGAVYGDVTPDGAMGGVVNDGTAPGIQSEIPEQVDFEATEIAAGIAVVGINGKYGYIAPGLGDDETFINLKYEFAGDFSDNLAFVGTLNADGSLEYSIIDIADVVLFRPGHVVGTVFSENKAAAKVAPDIFKFYEFSGSIVEAFVDPMTGEAARFEEAQNFSEGFAGVKIGGSWGYISLDSALPVIKPIYTQVMPFKEGLASVKDSTGKWGTIDKSGNTIVPFDYDQIGEYQNGYALATKTMMVYSLSKTGGQALLYTHNSSETISSEDAQIFTVNISQGSINIREMPSADAGSAIKAKADKDSEVELIETSGEWSKIRLPSGIEGYAKTDLLKEKIE